VDGYDFEAYEAAGFGRFDRQDKDVAKEGTANMSAPDLGGWKGWWNYLSAVSKVSPIPEDQKFGEIPEGVLRLGGTFVLSPATSEEGKADGEIAYRWSDRIPGDHPAIDEVWNVAKASAAASAEASKKTTTTKKQLPIMQGLSDAVASMFGGGR